jgi:hypothetical protein
MADSVTLVSHPNKSFEGARDLKTEADGFLLCVTRQPLYDACHRLRQEGYPSDTMVIIKDCASDALPVVAGKIKDVLA